VLQRGVELGEAIGQAGTQLTELVGTINTELGLQITAVNQITSDILSLNKMISMSEVVSAGPGSSNDLRDQRDLLVDRLSGYLSIRVTEDRDGNYNIQSGAVNLVNSNKTTRLETYSSKDPDYGYEVLNVQAGGIPVTLTAGELKGMVDMRDDPSFGVKGYLDKLATVSKFLLRDFNEIHREGYGEDNVSGRNFFGEDDRHYTDAQYTDPSDANFMDQSAWLAALMVKPELLDQTTDPPGLQMIAAKTLDTQGNASGDNAVKLSQAIKTSVNDASLLGPGFASTLGSKASLDSFYSSVIGVLGIQGQSTNRLVENQKTLVSQIESWRQSVSGVNMDEEMTNMIRFQKGYNAAARVITTMDEMFDKLINGMGVVGR
jgi:flagellar hook-associated protein 1 FlgK